MRYHSPETNILVQKKGSYRNRQLFAQGAQPAWEYWAEKFLCRPVTASCVCIVLWLGPPPRVSLMPIVDQEDSLVEKQWNPNKYVETNLRWRQRAHTYRTRQFLGIVLILATVRKNIYIRRQDGRIVFTLNRYVYPAALVKYTQCPSSWCIPEGYLAQIM